MSGKCVYCNAETKTKMNFVHKNGIKFEYHCCMRGPCATKSIDSAFEKEEGHRYGGPDFDIPEIGDDIKALFA